MGQTALTSENGKQIGEDHAHVEDPIAQALAGEAEGTVRRIEEALVARFDLPVSVDTFRASVLDESCKAGAVVGNDISGFADPEFLPVAARHGVSVVACHVRLAPRVPDPDPVYVDLIDDVRRQHGAPLLVVCGMIGGIRDYASRFRFPSDSVRPLASRRGQRRYEVVGHAQV